MDTEQEDSWASRGDFIASLGGPARIAQELELSGHNVVSNWYKNGFPHSHKEALIALARRENKEPHPDLFTEKKPFKWGDPSPLSAFIKQIADQYGSYRQMALATGIPLQSIRSMCQRKKRVMLVHVPTLEKAANEKGVELPEFWENTRRDYESYAAKKNRKHIDIGNQTTA